MRKIPKYDFRCKKCGFIEERNILFEEAEKGYPCPKCRDIMERQFSPQGTVFHTRWGKPKVRQKVKRMGA